MTNRLFLVPYNLPRIMSWSSTEISEALAYCPKGTSAVSTQLKQRIASVGKMPFQNHRETLQKMQCTYLLGQEFFVHQLPFWELEWIWWNWFQLHKFHFHFRHERNFLRFFNRTNWAHPTRQISSLVRRNCSRIMTSPLSLQQFLPSPTTTSPEGKNQNPTTLSWTWENTSPNCSRKKTAWIPECQPKKNLCSNKLPPFLGRVLNNQKKARKTCPPWN